MGFMGMQALRTLVSHAEVLLPYLRKYPVISRVVGAVLFVCMIFFGSSLLPGSSSNPSEPKVVKHAQEQRITFLQEQFQAERARLQSLLEMNAQVIKDLTTALTQRAPLQQAPAHPPVEASWHLTALRPLHVRQVQLQMQALGFNPGPIDGRYGPRTEAALCRYQAAQAIRPSHDQVPDAQPQTDDQSRQNVLHTDAALGRFSLGQ